MPSSHLVLCLPLLPPSVFPSIWVFSSGIRWPKYWSFSFSISPSSEYSGSISFRIDWFDLLVVQGTLKSSPIPHFNGISSSYRWPEYWSFSSASVLPMKIQYWFHLGLTGWISLQSKGLSRNFPQHHSSKASTLQRSAFFIVQLSHPYMTTGKTTALTTWTFVGKVMSLLYKREKNTLSRFVVAFLPRSKHLLISWLQSLSTVILEPKKIKSVTVSTVSPSICHEVMGPDAMI